MKESIEKDRPTERQRDRLTYGQMDGQTKRQKERKRETERYRD
jgi:hypothetical protein